MTVPAELIELVERFERNIEAYKSGQYNEAQVRREYIDPLFELLGWDIQNKQGYAEAYKDVIHEDSLRIGGTAKAPDYGFRIGGTRKFFLEAKKPSIDVKGSVGPSYQLRRYAWSAKLPLSILTDFEEMAVYDCRVKPEKNDKASKARTIYLTFDQYPAKWEEISSIFSRDAVLKGSFDKYAEGTGKKRGTAEVDKAFLSEIESWRDILARNIALRNPDLTQRELNFTVQKIIDRIIFLRICEDRGIENYLQLMSLTSGPGTYSRLLELFRHADQRYNSGLFHFSREKGRPGEPDTLTPNIAIDDKALKGIIKNLYYPDSPYEFSVLPADILGQVYEQFLGKVIRLTKGHQARVEDKPEVKKAGGVYYTPTYIVDYIVKNTVAKLLDGKTSKQAEKLRILDPACGSGSFLIGAYQHLLDWHRKYYENKNPAKLARGKAPPIYQSPGGEWRLTTSEKKRILLNNIYGVDIDLQAVEVTKLSLLLKVLEDENSDTLQSQLLLFKERALPDLGDNIKCGNSLIGPDFYEGKQMSFLDEEERYRINVFDWDAEFPEIMKAGGFDAVIGNPPYVRIQTLKEWAPVEVEFYKEQYRSAGKGNFDVYVVFVERGLELLNRKGLLGFILPHKFFNAKYGESLRSVIADGKYLSDVVHFGHQQVFDGATTYTCLLFLGEGKRKAFNFNKVDDLLDWRMSATMVTGKVPTSAVTASEWNFLIGDEANLFNKLSHNSMKLGKVAEKIAQGIRTSANDIYVLDVIKENGEQLTVFSKQLNREIKIERGVVSQFLQGRDIKPFTMHNSGKLVIIPYSLIENRAQLINADQMLKNFPYAYEYLLANKVTLESRESGKMRGANWYAYIYPKNIELMLSSKILVPDIASSASFAFDSVGQYAFTSGYAITKRKDVKESEMYILGLLNSKVLDYYLQKISTQIRGGYFRYFTQYLEQLPLRSIDFGSASEVNRHNEIVELVNQVVSMNENIVSVKEEHDKNVIQRQINIAIHRIDKLVYELYGLTDKEIRIVEGEE